MIASPARPIPHVRGNPRRGVLAILSNYHIFAPGE